jgi:hypothetical protein
MQRFSTLKNKTVQAEFLPWLVKGDNDSDFHIGGDRRKESNPRENRMVVVLPCYLCD